MMTRPIKPIPNAEFFTAWVHEKGIDCLIRSADWYKLPPIQRYLYNMAATSIEMADAKTEQRSYTFDRFEHLRKLIERSAGQESEVAHEAWMLWGEPGKKFGVVHLDQADNRRGDLLAGDDPEHVDLFEPTDPALERWTLAATPSHGPEGSDV